MRSKGKLVIVSGPSGVGKGTVLEQVLRDESLNLTYSISMTTRKRRMGELPGQHYDFVSVNTFENAIMNNAFLEYAQFIDNYYGTPVKQVEDLLNQQKNVLLEIEVQGSLQVMDKRPEAITIFLVPPSIRILESRIRNRNTENHELIKRRINKAQNEMSLADRYKYKVINNTVRQAAEEIKQILKEELKC